MRARLAPVAVVAVSLLVGASCTGVEPEGEATDSSGLPVSSMRPTTGLPASTLPEAPNPVAAVDLAFEPRELTVAVGDTVTWRNAEIGEVDHWVVAEDIAPGDDLALFDSATLRPGNSYAFTFDVEPGRYPYFCNIHPSMQGAIVVG